MGRILSAREGVRGLGSFRSIHGLKAFPLSPHMRVFPLPCPAQDKKNAPNFFSALFTAPAGKIPAGSRHALFFAALRTGEPSMRQMPKPVTAQIREKMGTNQLKKA